MKVRKAFDKVDLDKNGVLSREEFSNVLSVLGDLSAEDKDQLGKMFDICDIDGDGTINFDEFIKVIIRDIKQNS